MTPGDSITDGPSAADDGSCEFCGIVSGRLPKEIRYQDDDLIVFRNMLTWVPLMYLVVPKVHLSQKEFWHSPLFARAAALAVDVAGQDAPSGFRLVSNFGDNAAQTQPHGHLHVVGGDELGLYMDFPQKGDYWLRRFGYTDWHPDRRHRNRPSLNRAPLQWPPNA